MVKIKECPNCNCVMKRVKHHHRIFGGNGKSTFKCLNCKNLDNNISEKYHILKEYNDQEFSGIPKDICYSNFVDKYL